MDPPEPTEREGRGGGGGGRVPRILFGCCASIVFCISASFLFSFLFGLAAIAFQSISSSSPALVPAACRIVSSGVDLRSSKVCELGLLNYKAKHVFYPSEKSRFRCHHDYYWASVFEVEYKELFSGQIYHAVAEAPREALPHDCRPNFGTAWSMKMKFKVNETYNCRYTLGSHKAEIYTGNLFNCEAKGPSTVEMIRRFIILFTRSSSDMGGSGRNMVYAVVGVVSGMLLSMCVVILVKSLQVSVPTLTRQWHARKSRIRAFAARFRRVCLFVAYFSAMGWLTLEYGKMIGLKQLFDTNTRDRIVTR